ncbi:hypothetical protein AMECASPLE_037513 [Ameca splendens]|uniref:Uncharacterized protein n=1 Tax=Ameca splendens TaxID=208324 RepID=A0ABV0ZT59_9TELE
MAGLNTHAKADHRQGLHITVYTTNLIKVEPDQRASKKYVTPTITSLYVDGYHVRCGVEIKLLGSAPDVFFQQIKSCSDIMTKPVMYYNVNYFARKPR